MRIRSWASTWGPTTTSPSPLSPWRSWPGSGPSFGGTPAWAVRRPEKPSILTIGGICLDDEAKSVTVDGEPANLTPMEFAILRLLMSNPGKVYSSRSLYEAVWNEAPLGSEGAVAVHIRHLREKIEINPSDPRYLKVVWGQGYKMEGGKP